MEEKKKWDRQVLFALFLNIVAVPAAIYAGNAFFQNRGYYFTAFVIVILAMLPFFILSEQKKMQTRKMILISVMVAAAVAGRAAFFMLPEFKPVIAIIILAGMTLGPQAGFLTGALTALVSNFFFGQGPWTPWQMFAMGIIGFLAGVLFFSLDKKVFPLNKKYSAMGRTAEEMNIAAVGSSAAGGESRKRDSLFHRERGSCNLILLCIFGGFSTFAIYGVIMDTSSVLMYTSDFTLGGFLAFYLSGLPFNAIHGASTVIFLFLLARPFIKRIDRIRVKYGII